MKGTSNMANVEWTASVPESGKVEVTVTLPQVRLAKPTRTLYTWTQPQLWRGLREGVLFCCVFSPSKLSLHSTAWCTPAVVHLGDAEMHGDVCRH